MAQNSPEIQNSLEFKREDYPHAGIEVHGHMYTREDIAAMILGIAQQPGKKDRRFMLTEISRTLYGKVLPFTDARGEKLILICDNAIAVLKDSKKLDANRFVDQR